MTSSPLNSIPKKTEILIDKVLYIIYNDDIHLYYNLVIYNNNIQKNINRRENERK